MLIDVHRWMGIIFPVWIDPSFSRGTRDKQFISFSFFFMCVNLVFFLKHRPNYTIVHLQLLQ